MTTYSLLIPVVFAGGLFLLAAVVLASVLMATRGRRISWAKVALAFVATLWLVPIVAILSYLSLRAVSTIGHAPPARVQFQVSVDEAARERMRGRSDRVNNSHAVPGLETVVSSPAGAIAADAKTGDQPIAEALPESDSKLPEWVVETPLVVADKQLVVLSSQRFATVEEADAQVMKLAREVVIKDLKAVYAYEPEPPVSDRDIESRAFGRRHVEQSVRKSGTNTFTVYRVHRQLELSPSLRSALEPQWREKIVNHRLGILAALAGLLTLTAATAAAYFRIDTRTGAMYRRRLRFAAVCVIAAGGLAAMTVIG